MKYRYFFIVGVACLILATVLDWLRYGEENSFLVFGPAFMGLSAIFSPLILGGLRSPHMVGLRPGGRAVIQSLLFPFLGLGMFTWGILGEWDLVSRISFDGPCQHCQRCGTIWRLEGARDGRPKTLEGCAQCLDFPEAKSAAQSLFSELITQVREAQSSGNLSRVDEKMNFLNRSPLHVHFAGQYLFDWYPTTMEPRLDTAFGAPLKFVFTMNGVRKRLDEANPVYQIQFDFALIDSTVQADRFRVKREGEFVGHPLAKHP